ncbi:hypothetical protein C8R45DRAFT_431343 [Mycena sanguinolenta]|nr:hypothetical protein C8R45DRAFT_431343 [Mycena sanguinolenta]
MSNEPSIPKTYVVGLLATTDVGALDDRRMAEDFGAFHDLFSHAHHAVWLTAADWSSVIGDPKTERVELSAPAPITIIPLTTLWVRFIFSVSDAAKLAQKTDTIVIVLCGRGEEDTGRLVLGTKDSKDGYFLGKEEIELSLRCAEVPAHRILLLSTACHSRRWRCDEWWTLFSGADPDQESSPITGSASREMQGGVSAFSVLVEHPDGHRLTAPHSDAARWKKTLRETLGGVYSKSSSASVELLHRLRVVDSSVPDESGDMAVAAVPAFLPLSAEEKGLLFEMATAHNKVEHANTGPNIKVNGLAKRVANGRELSELEERYLLECLRYLDREYRRVSIIAKEFGWPSREPPEKWCHANWLDRMKVAEAAGAAIATEFFGSEVGAKWWVPHTKARYRRYKAMAPGGWLANAWISAGSPVVSKEAWAKAVLVANAEADR